MTDGPIECEVKLRLASRADLDRLLARLPAPRRWGLQLNLYLDTPDGTLAANGMSLRLRVTPDHARLTLKVGRGVDGCTFRCIEIEEAIDRGAAIAWIQGTGPLPLGAAFDEAARHLNAAALVAGNWSLTHRALCDTDGMTVEVDETLFPDGSRDWEVEVEHPDPDAALAVVRRFADLAGVALAPQTRTKQARAQGCLPVLHAVIPTGDPADGIPGHLALIDEKPGS
jgi:uncharacterized protein YjbK